MKSIQQLRERRNAKALESRKLCDEHQGDSWNAEIAKRVDDILAEVDRLDSQIEAFERTEKVNAQSTQRVERRALKDGVSDDEANHTISMEKSVFTAYLRNGSDGLNAAQREFVDKRMQAALSTGTPSEGGYLSPTDFAATLLEEVVALGGMRSVATVMRTDHGRSIEMPTVDDTAQEGEILGENAAAGDLDPTFDIKSISAYKYSSKAVAVPFELLMDTAIDLESYIIRLLAKRIFRITNKHQTIGTGTGQPQGAVTGSVLGKLGVTGQTTGVTYDDFVDLEHSIDPELRNSKSCGWMFHDDTLKIVKKIKDADGRPLWLPGIHAGDPDVILNKPFTINQNMPVMEASAKSILFGDFSAYLIRDVMDVMLFRMTDSVYTKKGQVGFLSFSRHDSKLMDVNGNSIKHYQNAAT